MSAGVQRWVESTLGAYVVARAESPTAVQRAAGRSVLRVVDGDGRDWYVKQLRNRAGWRAEVRAYRQWAPRLGDSVPRMRAAHAGLRAVLLSAVPGEPVSPGTPDRHRQAGAVLRRLHDVLPSRATDGSGIAGRVARIEALLAAEGALLDRREHDLVAAALERLREVAPGPAVPCHGDFGPHHWRVGDDGVLRVIDFERSRWAPAEDEFIRWWLPVRAFLALSNGTRDRVPWLARRGRARLAALAVSPGAA